MLNGIHIVDFGNHRNTRLTFGPMTALVGKNGSGKTTVMRAIGKMEKMWNDKGGTSNWAFARRGSQGSILTAGWTDERRPNRTDWGIKIAASTYKFRRCWPDRGPAKPWIPEPGKYSDEKPVAFYADDFAVDEGAKLAPGEIERIVNWEQNSFRWTCRYFKTNAGFLQHSAVADDEAPVINDDGSNLAWALAYLMTAQPDRFARIVEALKEVVPIVKRIRSRPVKLTRLEKRTVTINKQERAYDEEREVMGQELIFDMMSGDDMPAASVSEGTLVVLAVLTLVYGGDQADLIMLDDVELGLHPKAQRDLMRQLRMVQEKNPKLQIIVSTHSPYVIDEFKPEDVWLFSTDSEGCAVSKRLSEHPDAKRGLEVLTTGEFWSAEGESWVLGEEPTVRVAEEPVK
jgi:predicted ATPase